MDNSILTAVYKRTNGGIPPKPRLLAADIFDLVAQSGTAPTSIELHADNTMHSYVADGATMNVGISDSVSQKADITTFLNRKVRIASYQWSVGGDFANNFNPWHLFLNNTAVKNKLQNYNLVKGDLKLTFFINGTPFHMGMMLASYVYLGKTNEAVTIGGDTQLVTRSQRPHLYLNAATCKGGCLCIPFFLPQNYLSLAAPIISATNIGTVHLDSFAQLRQLNAGTDVVSISVFAEMMNPVLTGPTSKLVSMSSIQEYDFELIAQADEYTENGVISGPANAVANFANYFTAIPTIGPFAVATQIGARAVGSIAKMFGYSKPATIADVGPMRNFPVSNMALTEGTDTTQKMTVTGKQEMTIDSRTLGLDGTDEMALKSIYSRESYITKFVWTTTKTVGSTIFAMAVDPMAERQSVVGGATGNWRMIPTALSFATRPFAAWSGKLRYRFQIIASQYHRGRLAIVYDPVGPAGSDPFNTSFNTIIDLADGRDFTVEFDWQQGVGYQEVNKTIGGEYWNTTLPNVYVPPNPGAANGAFYVQVVNELVSPDSTTPVELLVSISAGENYELMNPDGDGIDLDAFVPLNQVLQAQSAVEETPTLENAPEAEINVINVTADVVTTIAEKPLVFYGESVNSFRQLLKRYCHFRTLTTPVNGTETLQVIQFELRALPILPGFDPLGPDVTTIGTPYSYVNSTYIGYLQNAFAGWKGSLRYKACPNRSTVMLRARRVTGATLREKSLTMIATPTTFPASSGQSLTARAGMTVGIGLGSGAVMTQTRSQDALEFEVPNTVPLRFCKTATQYLASNTYEDAFPGGDSFILDIGTSTVGGASNVDLYVAAGEDFSFYGWVGAPVVYTQIIPP